MNRFSTIQVLTTLFVFFFIYLKDTNAQSQADTSQRDLIDYGLKLFKSKPPRDLDETSRKVRFSIVPVSNANQDRVAVSAINLGFYCGDPAKTNLSTVYFYPYTNFSGRYSFSVLSNIWTSENIYNPTGDFIISSNSQDDYGLGSASSSDSAVIIEFNHSRFHAQVSRLMFGFFYVGVGYNLDYYYQLSQENQDVFITDFERYPYGTDPSTTSSGITINLTRDSRKNSINPHGGFYTNLSFRIYEPSLGSTYAWNALYADARKYFPMPTKRRSILALRALYWETFGDVPYLEQPATFTDREGRVGRGYPYARFRGKGMLYGETEYRFPVSRHQFWGGVLFMNAQSFREPDSGNFERINPAAGFGLRMKFNKRSDSNLTLDFAFGKDSFNWYLNIGEFF